MPRSKESRSYPTYEQILITIENIKRSLARLFIKYWKINHPDQTLPPPEHFLKKAEIFFKDEEIRKKRLDKINKLADEDSYYFIILIQEILILKSIPKVLAELAEFED